LFGTVILPIKLVLGSRWTEYTPLIVGCLRQGVKCGAGAGAVFLITYMQTGFRSWLRSIGLFLYYLSIPALWPTTWVHPDSLDCCWWCGFLFS